MVVTGEGGVVVLMMGDGKSVSGYGRKACRTCNDNDSGGDGGSKGCIIRGNCRVISGNVIVVVMMKVKVEV